MTAAYKAWFVSVQLVGFLAFVQAWGFLVGGSLVALDGTDWSLAIWLWCAAALSLFVSSMLRVHSVRVRLRAGATPDLTGIWARFCCGDIAPRTEAALREALMSERRYSVVGSGWGFLLMRKGPPAPRLYTHRYTGFTDTNEQLAPSRRRWAAGNTIAAVVKQLEREGLTFSTHPTMDYISLGAWFARGNHGNGGNHSSARGSSNTVVDVRVYDMRTKQEETLSYKQLRRRIDNEDNARRGPGVAAWQPSRICIIDVLFDHERLVPTLEPGERVRRRNVVTTPQRGVVQKRGVIVNSPSSAQEWLAAGAHLRVLFMGGAKRGPWCGGAKRGYYGLGIRWEAPYARSDAQDHVDPHFAQRFCTYMQVDNCSVVGGWHESMQTFAGLTSHSNANRWMPSIDPIEAAFVVAAGYLNFEVVFRWPAPGLSGYHLFKFTQSLIAMHREIGGRSELRYGKDSPSTPVFLDMALRGSFYRVFELLANYNITRVALHAGKFWPPDEDITPHCRRVRQYDIYYGPLEASGLACAVDDCGKDDAPSPP